MSSYQSDAVQAAMQAGSEKAGVTVEQRQEVKVSDVIRAACDQLYGDGVNTEFTFDATQMAEACVRKSMPDVDDYDVVECAGSWLLGRTEEIIEKFKSSEITPIVSRHFSKIGKWVKVSVTMIDEKLRVVTISVSDEEVPVKKRLTRKRVSPADYLDWFVPDNDDIEKGDITVSAVRDLVRQMSAHKEKCGL
ncbi:hypothetical protein HOS16_gp66 [Shigella phage vB_SflS-ISF001]|uniref:Uncharacterized protein n=1 Tax=Shigella phage vB_SflS-ISF001 TaxID=2048005 RepID=A0A2D1GQ67_9CAUD|nr:hypothetical protein HOS16_gp66 [Shigella phage vB_SflS-ISF001]ATN94144.1 hypothetical protein FLXISF001_066 [Shigella phage vB_SflS-ISF001]